MARPGSKSLKTNTLWKMVKSYNYFQALEKILFTMIGLLLALWVNNWNDARKESREEQKMLVQIKSALEQDINDIEETIGGYQFRVDGSGFVAKSIKENSPVTDSLQMALKSLTGYSYLAANKGSYETLKSQGLALIHNDSLRLKIVTLYEVDYQNTEKSEQFLNKIYSEQLLPILYNKMEQTPLGMRPVDWDHLKSDNYFKELVNAVKLGNNRLLYRYSRLEVKVKSLTAEISRELGQGN